MKVSLSQIQQGSKRMYQPALLLGLVLPPSNLAAAPVPASMCLVPLLGLASELLLQFLILFINVSSFIIMIYVSIPLPQARLQLKVSKWDKLILPTFFFFKIILVILVSLLFCIIFGMTLSISTESLVGILIGIALNLYINNQLTHNSLPITEILTADRATLQA